MWSHLVSEVCSEVAVQSVQLLVVHLCQAGSQDVLPAEQRVVGEDETRHIHIQLVVPFWVPCSGYAQVGPLQCLG